MADDRERQAESRQILDRVAREADSSGLLGSAARRTGARRGG